MCQCTPSLRTPFCGRSGCEWPVAEGASAVGQSGSPKPESEGSTPSAPARGVAAHRLYVVVLDELSTAQTAVQGAHAVAEFSRHWRHEFMCWNTHGGALVFLRSKELVRLYSKLSQVHPIAGFSEEHRGGRLTAFAALDAGEMLKGLPLA
jgi:hypothetical protein